MIFIDLEKAYDRVLIEVMWWILEKKSIPLKYIKLINDICTINVAVLCVRRSEGIRSEFSIT